MIEIHVEDMEPEPGLWVSFRIQILYSKCSQDWSQLLDSDNDTKTTCILGKHELRQGWWSIFKTFFACLAYLKLAMLGKRMVQMTAERKLSLGHQVSFQILNPSSECFNRTGLSCLMLRTTQRRHIALKNTNSVKVVGTYHRNEDIFKLQTKKYQEKV